MYTKLKRDAELVASTFSEKVGDDLTIFTDTFTIKK